MKSLTDAIRKETTAEVHEDEIHRRIYSVDASIYEVLPLAIAIPRTKEDLLTILHLAKEAHVPVIPRGAATGITGGALGKGLVIDLSKYLNHILEVDIENGFALVEPGVIQDHLNLALKPHGYRLGPDTSTGNRATLGGMVGNNSAGSRSLKYGAMVDHVQEIELALAGGELIKIGTLDEQTFKTLYPALFDIRKLKSEIQKHFPNIPRRVSGYNLDRLLKPFPLNLCELIVGSEGTLGIATKIKLDICPLPGETTITIIPFDSMIDAMKAVPELLAYHPVALEVIDDKILEMARNSPSVKKKLGWLQGSPKALIIAELEGKALPQGYAVANPQDVWDVRKAGLGLLLSKRTFSRAIAFIEDITVAPDQLQYFIPEFLEYLKSKGKDAGIYGHVGSGCLHIRPYIDLRNPEEMALMQQIQIDVADMLIRHRGALSGEHGDGLVRSWQNERLFGPVLYQAFKQVKATFDPLNLMNPGKIVDGPAFLENLRTQKDPIQIDTFLDFSKEGGFALAVDMCNGNGLCRKKDNLMCPSFQATEDEYDSTRARAQSLRAIITGRLQPKMLKSQEIADVLDLCLECKGCKKECPSQVDMAKMKSEVLYQRGGFSLRSRLFGHIGLLQSLAPRAFFNWINSLTLTKKLLGVAKQRALPLLAPERFSTWFATYEQPACAKEVALFNDTFTEFNHPNIGQAAVRVLNTLGYRVSLIPWHCCGRPMISKGLLKEAKKHALALQQLLKDYSTPIIALEPSCHSALIDDYEGLIGTPLKVELFDSFIAKEELALHTFEKEILVHGHCHQKALLGMEATLTTLQKIPGAHVREIPSGCCGMAGSFGYEKEHYELSMKIGSLKLFPTIKNASQDALIVTNGMSCRHQIEQGTGKKVLHLSEILDRCLHSPI